MANFCVAGIVGEFLHYDACSRSAIDRLVKYLRTIGNGMLVHRIDGTCFAACADAGKATRGVGVSYG